MSFNWGVTPETERELVEAVVVEGEGGVVIRQLLGKSGFQFHFHSSNT